nr:MAG TPA: hypothetical protein [Caudoviricetes sp.]
MDKSLFNSEKYGDDIFLNFFHNYSIFTERKLSNYEKNE